MSALNVTQRTETSSSLNRNKTDRSKGEKKLEGSVHVCVCVCVCCTCNELLVNEGVFFPIFFFFYTTLKKPCHAGFCCAENQKELYGAKSEHNFCISKGSKDKCAAGMLPRRDVPSHHACCQTTPRRVISVPALCVGGCLISAPQLFHSAGAANHLPLLQSSAQQSLSGAIKKKGRKKRSLPSEVEQKC